MTFDSGKRTTMAEAFERAGVKRDETWQEAAVRIWNSTKRLLQPRGRAIDHGFGAKRIGDPIEAMRKFDCWVRSGSPERIISIIGDKAWERIIRGAMDKGPSEGGWAHGAAFRGAMLRLERDRVAAAALDRYHTKRKQMNHEEFFQHNRLHQQTNRDHKRRKRLGIKVVRAEVDVTTGAVINLIDKEYGPFAHIRVSGLPLSQVTTEQALKWCDRASTDVKFVRALCQQIPDPRKPIGEQWTVEIVRKARQIAER